MNHHPVDAEHLQQIYQLNEIFLDLLGREEDCAGLSAQARRQFARSEQAERHSLARLPRVLFRFQLSHSKRGTFRPAPDAIRAFHLAALLVAFHMVRESRFAARVLFPGSGSTLGLLARADLVDLIDFSARVDLLSCPLLEPDGPAARFLAGGAATGALSRHARIALAQWQSMVGLPPPDTLAPVSALAHAY